MEWTKWLGYAFSLAFLWQSFKGLRPRDPETATERYAPAAATLLAQSGAQATLAAMPPEEQATAVAGLPAALRIVHGAIAK